ncbi:hypothetical protein AAE478_001888 [Parahypoxylon ruwenzoriense]
MAPKRNEQSAQGALQPAHSVKPVFERFRPEEATFFGNMILRSSYCEKCDLTFMSNPGEYGSHPSHACSDGQRYLVVRIEPYRFFQHGGLVNCWATYYFGKTKYKTELNYTGPADLDSGSEHWNLDNAEIATLCLLVKAMEENIIPLRRKILSDAMQTNNAEFLAAALKCQLIVYTSINRDLLDFLLLAPELRYSKSREAFVKTSMGFVTKKYPVTQERRLQIAAFIKSVKYLAYEHGIQIRWVSVEPSTKTKAARAAFAEGPQPVPKTLSGLVNAYGNPGSSYDPHGDELFLGVDTAERTVDEDLLEGDSFEDVDDDGRAERLSVDLTFYHYPNWVRPSDP